MKLADYIKDTITILYISNNTCSVCGVVEPKIEQFLEENYPKLKLTVVKIDENPELKGELMIFTVPAVLIYFEGKEVFRKAGYVSPADLDDILDKIYGI